MDARSGVPCVSGLRRYRAPAILMLLLHLGACAKWTAVTPTPIADFVSEEDPNRVRATTSDGTRIVLQNPTVRNDSIMGVIERCDPPLESSEGLACQRSGGTALDLSDVAVLEVRRADVTDVVGGFLLITVVAGAVTYLVVLSMFDPS